MIVAICGASGSGKDTIAKFLLDGIENTESIIPITTRQKRYGEIDGQDYYFVPVKRFKELINNKDKLAYYEEYSQERFYGVLKSDIQSALSDKNILYVVVVTPNGLRAINEIASKDSNSLFMSVFVNVCLGTRVSRYIDRIEVDNFTFDDMNEINARVNRDFGMFLNIEKECDLVIENPDVTKEKFESHMMNIVDSIITYNNIKNFPISFNV